MRIFYTFLVLILLCFGTTVRSQSSFKNSILPDYDSSSPDDNDPKTTSAPTMAPTTTAQMNDNSRKGSDDDFIQFHRTDYSFLYLFNFIFAGTNLILLIVTSYALFSTQLYNSFVDGAGPSKDNLKSNESGRWGKNADDKYGVIQFNSVVPFNDSPKSSNRIVVRARFDDHDETNLNPSEQSDDFFDFELIAETIEADLEEQQQQQARTRASQQHRLQQPSFDLCGLLLDRRPNQADPQSPLSPTQLQRLQHLQHRYSNRSRFSIFPLRSHRSSRTFTSSATASSQPRSSQVSQSGITIIQSPPTTLPHSRRRIPRRLSRLFGSSRWVYNMNMIAFILFGWHFGLASFGLNSLGTKYYAANIIITNIISIIALLLCVFHLLYRRIIFVFFTFCLVVAFISTSMIAYFDK